MTGKNSGVRSQSRGKSATKNELSLPRPDKVGAPPLMTKSHYSFEEALQFIKAKFGSFTPGNLLNHGFQGDVSLFVQVPPGLEIESYFFSKDLKWQSIAPTYLIINSLDCEEIERKGAINQNAFDRGYVYKQNYGFLDALPSYHPNTDSSITPHWKTTGYNKIPITIKNLLVTHAELICLSQILAFKQESIQHDVHDRSFFKPIPKSLHLLNNLPAGTIDCRPIDLLRRAIQRNLNVLAILPSGVSVRSSSASDYATGMEYVFQPQFLTLDAAACTEIYTKGSASISIFQAGYIADNFGQIKRITPADERPGLADENSSWRTYRGNELCPLNLTCQHLYAMRPDVAELLDQDECQDFKISKESLALLTRMDFVSLESAVKIAKLEHPECTTNHLLRMGHKAKFSIVTPIPVAIEVNQYRQSSANKLKFNSLAESPVLLDLSSNTCLEIERSGKTSTDTFFWKYWTFIENQFRRESALGTHMLATYYKHNLHKIELKTDRLFISKAELFRVINDNSNLWDTIGEMLEVERKKCEANSNEDTVAADQKEASCTDSDVRAKKELNQLTTAKTAPGEALTELPYKKIKQLTKKEVAKRLNFGTSKIDYLVNAESPRFKPDFPKPIGGFGQKKYWIESEVEDYLALLVKRHPGSDSDD
jgi:predicted DNA-binding transcriptional regulator AlpA